MRLSVQADRPSRRAGSHRRWLKRRKNRVERRRARRDPATPPAYGRYRGYAS